MQRHACETCFFLLLQNSVLCAAAAARALSCTASPGREPHCSLLRFLVCVGFQQKLNWASKNRKPPGIKRTVARPQAPPLAAPHLTAPAPARAVGRRRWRAQRPLTVGGGGEGLARATHRSAAAATSPRDGGGRQRRYRRPRQRGRAGGELAPGWGRRGEATAALDGPAPQKGWEGGGRGAAPLARSAWRSRG